MKRSHALVVLLLVATSSCGFSERVPLQAGGKVQHAELSTYGWTKSDLGQDIEIILAAGVKLADVIDMSMFGKLLPGSTHEDAQRLMGNPARVWTDNWGEAWHVYDLPIANTEVGCYFYTSGGTPSSCSWTLRASLKGDPKRVLLDPQLLGYLDQAEAAHPNVNTRSFEIRTSGDQQSVQVFVKSRIGAGAYWRDGKRSLRREGAPKRGAAQQRVSGLLRQALSGSR
jgi:hypothetical protein